MIHGTCSTYLSHQPYSTHQPYLTHQTYPTHQPTGLPGLRR